MKPYDWNEDKNEDLKINRGVGFEDVINAIYDSRLIKTLRHHNHKKYPNQFIYLVNIDNYAYCVPFTENKESIFLKTIYPSRKYTKKYLRKE